MLICVCENDNYNLSALVCKLCYNLFIEFDNKVRKYRWKLIRNKYCGLIF